MKGFWPLILLVTLKVIQQMDVSAETVPSSSAPSASVINVENQAELTLVEKTSVFHTPQNISLAAVSLQKKLSEYLGGTDPPHHSRIIGGSYAEATRYPYYCFWIARDIFDEIIFTCGCSLIQPDMVLTAAHCYAEDADIINSVGVIVNKTDRTSTTVYEQVSFIGYIGGRPQVWIPMGYNGQIGKDDVLVGKLTTRIVGIPPVTLNANPAVPPAGNVVKAIGLGQTTATGDLSPFLKVVDITVRTALICTTAFPPFYDHNTQLCAGSYGEGICNGDSGGPLIVSGGTASRDILVGITSYGRSGCADLFPRVPQGFTRVSFWYKEITRVICLQSVTASTSVYCRLSTRPPTSPPSEPPTQPAFCFSGASTVEIINKGYVLMRDVAIGDMVRVAGGIFSEVYSFGHYNPNVNAQYLSIDADLEKPLVISADHMVFIEKSNRAVPAINVVIGDKVRTVDGFATVKKIENAVHTGVFAPFTKDGTIVVDKVIASSYVSLSQEGGATWSWVVETFVDMHSLAHLFQAPHRLTCELVPSFCTHETYSVDGLSVWVERPLAATQWLLKQNVVVMAVVFLPIFALIIMFAAVEAVVVCPVWLGWAIVTTAVIRGWCHRQRLGKNNQPSEA